MTIKAKVLQAQEELKTFNTHTELTQWAKSQGMDNRSAFSNFKKALKEINIDYNALRDAHRVEKFKEIEESAKKAKQITLYTDAKASADRFAVCNQDGEVVWSGRFFGKVAEQSACELESAKKAVWLAKKVAEDNKLDHIKLKLYVDAEWLCYANSVNKDTNSKTGGKARALGNYANYLGVYLEVVWVSGERNPADKYTTATGYYDYNDNLDDIKIAS